MGVDMDASRWGRRVGRGRAQIDDGWHVPTCCASPYLDLGPLLDEALCQVPGGHCRPVVGLCVRRMVVCVGWWAGGGQRAGVVLTSCAHRVNGRRHNSQGQAGLEANAWQNEETVCCVCRWIMCVNARIGRRKKGACKGHEEAKQALMGMRSLIHIILLLSVFGTRPTSPYCSICFPWDLPEHSIPALIPDKCLCVSITQ